MPECQSVINKMTTLDTFSVKNFCMSKKSSTFASAIRRKVFIPEARLPNK